jgi:hypothetical protein
MTHFGVCEHCRQQFSYLLIHNGFNDTAYAYCDTCGRIAFFSAWSHVPEGAPMRYHQCIAKETEPFLKRCECGGRFRAGTAPRCPHCKNPLSAEIAGSYLEENAPGSATGWRWQRNWIGLYCIVVDGNRVDEPWRDRP